MKTTSMCCMFAILMLVSSTGFAQDRNAVQDFSATVVFTSDDEVSEGRIFSTKDKTRMELPDVVLIIRMDKNIVWALMPEERLYMEQSVKPEHVVATKAKIPREIERKLMGTETIDGRKTEKYRLVYSTGGVKETILVWLTIDGGVPLRSEAPDGGWKIEFKNLKMAKQPGALFEIPAGYKTMSHGMDIISELFSKKRESEDVEEDAETPEPEPKVPQPRDHGYFPRIPGYVIVAHQVLPRATGELHNIIQDGKHKGRFKTKGRVHNFTYEVTQGVNPKKGEDIKRHYIDVMNNLGGEMIYNKVTELTMRKTEETEEERRITWLYVHAYTAAVPEYYVTVVEQFIKKEKKETE